MANGDRFSARRGRAATWRAVSTLAFHEFALALSWGEGEGAGIARSVAGDAFAHALDETIAHTVAAGWTYVPPACPRLHRLNDGPPEWRDMLALGIEVATLRALGLGFDLSHALKAGDRPDPAGLVRAVRTGAVHPDGRHRGFMSGIASGPGVRRVSVDVAMWPRPGMATRAKARFDIPVVDPGSAPVVARLRGSDGTWMDLRRLGDGFVRPVLSPGTWTPIPLHGFEEAVGLGVPWRDDPFRFRMPAGLPSLHLADYAGDGPPRSERDRGHGEAEGMAARVAGLRAEGLHLIGDEVWRACDEPGVTLSLHGGVDDGEWRLGWDVGNLDADADQSTWSSASPVLPPILEQPETDLPWVDDAPGSFRLGDLADVPAACSRWIDAATDLPQARRLDMDDVARDVEPAAFPRSFPDPGMPSVMRH